MCHGIVFNQRQPLETVDPWNLDIWRKLLVCVCSENLITRNSFLSGLSIQQRTIAQKRLSTKNGTTSFRVYYDFFYLNLVVVLVQSCGKLYKDWRENSKVFIQMLSDGCHLRKLLNQMLKLLVCTLIWWIVF